METARLRAQQQKAADHQSAVDELRAKRSACTPNLAGLADPHARKEFCVLAPALWDNAHTAHLYDRSCLSCWQSTKANLCLIYKVCKAIYAQLLPSPA